MSSKRRRGGGLGLAFAMRLKHPSILPVVAWAVAFSALAAAVRADSVVPPFSYTKPSPDGRFLFVMIAPEWGDGANVWNKKKAAEIRAVRDTYPRSGLYRNDGSITPLWTVDWYAGDVEVASDGVHLVRHGPWARSLDNEAFSFFANGRLVRTYAIGELVDVEFLLPQTVSHFTWCRSRSYDEAALHYAIVTEDGNEFVFDVASGSIVREARHARVMFWAALGGLGALVIFAGVVVGLALLRRRLGKGAVGGG